MLNADDFEHLDETNAAFNFFHVSDQDPDGTVEKAPMLIANRLRHAFGTEVAVESQWDGEPDIPAPKNGKFRMAEFSVKSTAAESAGSGPTIRLALPYSDADGEVPYCQVRINTIADYVAQKLKDSPYCLPV